MLEKAWRRRGIPPQQTMELLQRLYERQAETAGAGRPGTRAAGSPPRGGIAPVVDGRMTLSERGAEMAERLAKPDLSGISDISFAARVDEGLDDIAHDPSVYRERLAEWVNEVRKVHGGSSMPSAQVNAPTGRFDGEDTLWEGFPECHDGSVRWAGPLSGMDETSETAASSDGEGDAQTSTRSADGGNRAAHPSLVPLSLWVTPEDLPTASDSSLVSVYSILWGSQVACVLKPATIRVTTLLFECQDLPSYDLAVDMVEIVDPGYTEAEPRPCGRI